MVQKHEKNKIRGNPKHIEEENCCGSGGFSGEHQFKEKEGKNSEQLWSELVAELVSKLSGPHGDSSHSHLG